MLPFPAPHAAVPYLEMLHLHDAIDLAALILDAAEGLHDSPEARAIVQAGRGPELRRLTAAVAARAALAVRTALSMPAPT